MGTPFRAGPEDAIKCPRCAKELPPRDVAQCVKGCGTWVSAFAATEVLSTTDRTEDSITRWWRVRAPCPHCREKMTLRGADPGFLQGCDVHGFWVDADAVRFTGLSAGVDETALDAKRSDTDRVDAERAARYALERERAQRKAALERLEAELDKKLEPGPNPYATELEPRGRTPRPAGESSTADLEQSRRERDDARRREQAEYERARSEREFAARAEAARQTSAAAREHRRAYVEMVATAIATGNGAAVAEELAELRERVIGLEQKLERLLSERRT